MLHPFFDAVSYPWHLPEAEVLRTTLYKAVPLPPRIQLLYAQSGPNLQPLNLTAGIPDIWGEALERLTTARRLQRFCEVIGARPDLAAVHAVVQAIKDAKDLIDEPTLSDDLIFVDRQPLRTELRRVAISGRVGVLLVRGPSGSGKSWTRALVKDLAKGVGARCICLYEGQVSTVDEALDTLFTGLGQADSVPPRLETEDAWFRRACSKLHVAGQKSGKVTWVVADDLGDYPTGPRMDPMIRQFFDQFALNMANPAFAEWFRLVLLDYPDAPVPTKWKKEFWVEDRPKEADLKADAITEFLMLWARRRDKQIDETNARKLAADIIATADAPPAAPEQAVPPRLERIHDALTTTLARL